MSFLDASGDIILDGTLTELGRKRMANGNFKIVKFTLGDDEINYALYDKNNESGSAYYDLEILQTPVFEATTGQQAGINYGLVSYTKKNLLYLPTIKRNNQVQNAALPHNGTIQLAMNSNNTYDSLVTAFGGTSGGGNLKVMLAGQRQGTKLIFETGLATTDLTGDAAGIANYITAQGLRSTGFEISMDSRFFSRVLHPGAGSTFNNSISNGEPQVSFPLRAKAPTARDRKRPQNSVVAIRAITSNVVYKPNANKSHTEISMFNLPASVTAFNFDLKNITTDMFSRYGGTVTIQGSVSNVSCYYIDSMVILTDKTTGAQLEIPIRILKKV